MSDLKIESLHFNLSDAGGHEHRVEGITRRAIDLMTERLPMPLAYAMYLESLAVLPIRLRLEAMSDEEAADRIANAIVDALILKLSV